VPAIVVMRPPVSRRRTRLLPESAIRRLPSGSKMMPLGPFKRAPVAGPLSPPNPGLPPCPATVVMTPWASTFRMTWLALSAMKSSPAGLIATLWGQLRVAWVAGLPSPAKRGEQVARLRGTNPVNLPATVVMMPFRSTLRITWLNVSAMYMFPVRSNVSILGSFIWASVAGPPSPENPAGDAPANVVTIPWAPRTGASANPSSACAAAMVSASRLRFCGPLNMRASSPERAELDGSRRFPRRIAVGDRDEMTIRSRRGRDASRRRSLSATTAPSAASGGGWEMGRLQGRLVMTGVLGVTVLAGALGPALPASTIAVTQAGVTPPARPNVLVVLTDDQRADSMAMMPKTRRWLQDGGTRFSEAYATIPICAPMRSSVMSGRYQHNHGVVTNLDAPERLDQSATIQKYLHDGGYQTGLDGKFLIGWPIATP